MHTSTFQLLDKPWSQVSVKIRPREACNYPNLRSFGWVSYESYVSTKANKVSTLRGPAQLPDLQGALCVPTYKLTCPPFLFPPRFLPSTFIAHIGFSTPLLLVDFSSSVVADSRSRAFRKSICAHKKKSPRIYTSMHSGRLELTKLAYTRLEDNLIRHRGDRLIHTPGGA